MDKETPRPSREELRTRLRAKLRGAASDAPDPRAAAEAAVMRAVGDDPQMLRLAHQLLRDPTALRRAARPEAAAGPTTASATAPAMQHEEEEEGLPPC